MIEGVPEGCAVTLSAEIWPFGRVQQRTQTGTLDCMIRMAPLETALLGQPAPPLLVERWFNAEPTTLAALRGRVVVLHLGFHVMDRSEARQRMEELHERFGGQGVIPIAVHRHWVVSHGMIERSRPLPYALCLDERWTMVSDLVPNAQACPGATCALYGVSDPPVVCLIDKKGIVRAMNPPNIDAWIQRLLNE